MIFYHQKDRENMLREFMKVKLEVLHENNWDIEPDFFFLAGVSSCRLL